MRIGVIARADKRGISFQVQEFARHIKPAKVLCVMLNDKAWPEDAGLWPGHGVTFVDHDRKDGHLPEAKVRSFLRGLDVVFAVETVYDWRLCDWAREMGVRTVVQMNPEMYAHWQPEKQHWPHPDAWVSPTDWLLDRMPTDIVLPVPCTQRPQVAAPPDDAVFRVLHVAGHAAAGDRNGTQLFCEAVPLIKGDVEVTIIGQDGWLPEIHLGARSRVRITRQPKGVDDRWAMYRDQHLLVSPRRYGGLSLPTLEAIACGVPVLMPNCSPNGMWPGPRIPGHLGRLHHAPGGRVPTCATSPREIAHEINLLVSDREALKRQMAEAVGFAVANSWDAWRPKYLEVLAG